MTWQNPWALSGLATLTLPVVIHLLSRTQAVVQRFPTLRFLDVSRVLPTRSPRVSDVPLLLVRMSILAAAAFALSGPLFNSTVRTEARNRSLARAIIVDTSASALRATGFATAAHDSLRARAERLGAVAQTSATITTSNVSSALPGAVAWLETQAGRGEVVILSDFQRAAGDSASLATVAARIGITPVRIADGNASSRAGFGTASDLRSTTTSVRVTVDSIATNGEWVAAPDSGFAAVTLIAQPADQQPAELARGAALRVIAPSLSDSTRRVSIIFGGDSLARRVLTAPHALSARWIATFISRLMSDPAFGDAVRSAPRLDGAGMNAPFVVLARNARGDDVIRVAEMEDGSSQRLVLVTLIAPGSMAGARLIGAVHAAAAVEWPVQELEPATMSDMLLRQLQRAPAVVANGGAASVSAAVGASDARWFWLAALAMLALEWWMRARMAERSELVAVDRGTSPPAPAARA
jgi:hypothetical protein